MPFSSIANCQTILMTTMALHLLNKNTPIIHRQALDQQEQHRTIQSPMAPLQMMTMNMGILAVPTNILIPETKASPETTAPSHCPLSKHLCSIKQVQARQPVGPQPRGTALLEVHEIHMFILAHFDYSILIIYAIK